MAFRWRTKTKQGGEKIWYVTMQVPECEAGGEIAYRTIERSTGFSVHRTAERWAQEEYGRWRDRAYRGIPQKKNELTFAGAATTYLRTKTPSKRDRGYISNLLNFFGTRRLSEIDQNLTLEACQELYPGTATPTINRCVFTPIISIMTLVKHPHQLTRPEGHDRKPQIQTPKGDEWFEKVLPECNPQLVALVLCWTLHISRVQELLDRTPGDLNPQTGALTVSHTKSGEPRTILLSEPVLSAIFSYDWPSMKWLFRYNNRSNVYRDLRKACDRAGVEYFSPYKFGRHRSTRRLLEAGKSLKFVQAAGRWKTIKIPAERYGHLEHSEVDAEVNEFAADWAKKRGFTSKVQALKPTANTRQK